MKKTKIMKATKNGFFISFIIFILLIEGIEQALFKFNFSSAVFQGFL